MRYDNPHDWLLKRIGELESMKDAATLADMMRVIAPDLDPDTIQDAFEEDMDAAGYFESAAG